VKLSTFRFGLGFGFGFGFGVSTRVEFRKVDAIV